MRRRPVSARTQQLALTLFKPTTKLIPTTDYASRVTSSMLRWLGPPHALSFDEAWEKTMEDLPAPIGWRGAGKGDKASPVLFLRERLLMAWEDDTAVDFTRDDLAAVFDYSGVAARAGGTQRASVVA